MTVYNGKLYAGTLPLGQVYRYDGGDTWTLTGQLDTTPGVKYRRVWSMAIYRGRLFAGTLPSGRVYALRAGANVTHDHELEPGWRRLAAVRRGGRLELYVDDGRVATSAACDASAFDLSTDQPPADRRRRHRHLQRQASRPAAVPPRPRGRRHQEARFMIDAHVHVLAKESREFPREVSGTIPADREESVREAPRT